MSQNAPREKPHATRDGEGEGAVPVASASPSPSWDLAAASTPARRPRAVPRHFALRRAMGGAEGDVFRRGRGRGRRISARERPPRGVLRQPKTGHAAECLEGEAARHGRRRRGSYVLRNAARGKLHATRDGEGEGAAPVARQHRPPRAVPRHFARRQAVESTKGDGFRRVWGQRRRIRGRKRRPCGVPRQRRAGRARRARG